MPIAQRGDEFSRAGRHHAAAAGARRLPLGSRADARRRWSPTSSRRPTRWSTRSTPTTRASTARSSAICCSRSSSRPSCALAEGKFGIDDVVRAIAPSWSAAIRTCSATSRSRTPTRCSPTGASSRRPRKEKGRSDARSTACRVELPALLRAQRIGEKAGAVGFDWPDADGRARKGRRGAGRDRRGGGERRPRRRSSTSSAICCSR